MNFFAGITAPGAALENLLIYSHAELQDNTLPIPDRGPTANMEFKKLRAGSDVESLQHQLQDTRERLQSTVEEYETAHEELRCGNEELQSTNEELATSQTELQSVNGQLHAVNQRLASKISELHRVNADLSNLFESTQIATVFLDRSLVIRTFTPAMAAIFNLIPEDRGRPITDISHRLDQVDLRRDICQVLEDCKPIERSVALRGGKTFHLMRILPYRTAEGHVDGVLVTFVDVTAVAAAEEQQRLLVSELNHRVRNMLQVVIGLANQTLHRSQDLKQFESAFMGRMQSLARAYELLSRDGWKNVPIADLLRTQLSPFASEGKRYSARGANVVLTANAALSMGLVMYELATNATKYGALSVPEGHVDISWKLAPNSGEGEALKLSWHERDGPRVEQPKRKGFGSELLQRQLRYELSGEAALNYAAEGLQVTLTIPASGVVLAEGAAGK